MPYHMHNSIQIKRRYSWMTSLCYLYKIYKSFIYMPGFTYDIDQFWDWKIRFPQAYIDSPWRVY